MIIFSNGTRVFVIEGKNESLSISSGVLRAEGYCFEIMPYPAKDGEVVTAINNVAASAVAGGDKSATCLLNFDSERTVWCRDVDEDSNLYNQIKSHYISPEPAAEPAAEPVPETDKIAKIKELLSSLSESEIKALTGK